MTGTGGVDQPRWSVGALAKATGLTVRTLHHYDELGLLTPSERTRAGHRRYTERDLHRLYRIRLLRQLGMSLDSIGSVLAEPEALRDVLNRRADELDDEVWRLSMLRRQVGELLEHLDDTELPDTGTLLAQLGRNGIFQDSLTKQQRMALSDQWESLGQDGQKQLDVEWPQVLARLAEHCHANDPVDSPAVRETAARLVRVIQTFAGGDMEIVASMNGFFREHGLEVLGDVDAGHLGVGDELWDYISRALTDFTAK
ncbi:MerR family transcriptional regulator [Actinocrispum wychmicini]|uniref:DNA-binding transcriptional MerR regulator n=1 Tax=Actinocrispum wychmicini TaxID=1213861 RepID=A0A4R2K6N8_9PSEU|nr:MerR family transcriptional regulator [Actinocrispum wychmicini]TCO65606.1 DNA-binding transcriptional MerR regulator [Actinocrispum wychmicini]